MLDRSKQINQRAPYSIDSPDHDHIEAAPLRLLQHFIKTGTLVPALGSADSRVAESLDNLPTSAHGDLSEPCNLVLHRLPVCADADVQGSALQAGRVSPLDSAAVLRPSSDTFSDGRPPLGSLVVKRPFSLVGVGYEE